MLTTVAGSDLPIETARAIRPVCDAFQLLAGSGCVHTDTSFTSCKSGDAATPRSDGHGWRLHLAPSREYSGFGEQSSGYRDGRFRLSRRDHRLVDPACHTSKQRLSYDPTDGVFRAHESRRLHRAVPALLGHGSCCWDTGTVTNGPSWRSGHARRPLQERRFLELFPSRACFCRSVSLDASTAASPSRGRLRRGPDSKTSVWGKQT
jgi:hypothetical protein